MSTKREAENLLADCLEERLGKRPEIDHKFHPTRKWQLDLAYTDLKIAVELDGLRYHSGAKAQRNDREKQNELVRMGWKPLRFIASDVFVASKIEGIVEQIAEFVIGASGGFRS